MKIFQKPDAGAAMDGRYEELHLADATIGKVEEISPDLFIVEISEFIADLVSLDLNARMVFNIVIFTCIAFAQDLIYHLTPIAAKVLAVIYNRFWTAIFTAVETWYFLAFSHSLRSKVRVFDLILNGEL